MEKTSKNRLVMNTTAKIINVLSSSLDKPSTKATLSNLRNSIGRPISDKVKSLQIIFEYMPKELLSNSFEMTKEEKAILTTLELYAIHQQSNTESVNGINEGNWNNIGYSFKSLRTEGEAGNSIDKRFNALVTSATFDELAYHLRQMVKLLKSKSKNTKVDYPSLAGDLYNFLWENDERIRLNWERAYYSYSKSEDEKGEIENEQ